MSKYFDALERELVDAARRDAAPAQSRWRLRRPAHPLLVALAMLGIGVPAAAAVREVFTPVREPDGQVRLSADTVVARGVFPARGRWELVASKSDQGGCLGIRFLDDPEGAGLARGCGPQPRSELYVAYTGGGELPEVISGTAPTGTATVRLIDRRERLGGRASTQPGPSRYPGVYFALETTVNRARGCVQALDRNGEVLEAVDTDGNPCSRSSHRASKRR